MLLHCCKTAALTTVEYQASIMIDATKITPEALIVGLTASTSTRNGWQKNLWVKRPSTLDLTQNTKKRL